MYVILGFLAVYLSFIAGYLVRAAECEPQKPVEPYCPRHLKLRVIEGVKINREKFRPFGLREDDCIMR